MLLSVPRCGLKEAGGGGGEIGFTEDSVTDERFELKLRWL